jgi:hypothetical protein
LLFCWWLHGAASGWIVVRWKRRESTKAENSRKLGERGERERDCEGGKEKSTREGEGEKVSSQSNQSCLQCYNFFFFGKGVSQSGGGLCPLSLALSRTRKPTGAHWGIESQVFGLFSEETKVILQQSSHAQQSQDQKVWQLSCFTVKSQQHH